MRGWKQFWAEELRYQRHRTPQGTQDDGCVGPLILLVLWVALAGGIVLGVLYLIIRFVKWAWTG